MHPQNTPVFPRALPKHASATWYPAGSCFDDWETEGGGTGALGARNKLAELRRTASRNPSRGAWPSLILRRLASQRAVMSGCVARSGSAAMSERAVGVETICRFCSSIKWRSKRRWMIEACVAGVPIPSVSRRRALI